MHIYLLIQMIQQFEVDEIHLNVEFITNAVNICTSQDNNRWTGVVWINCGLLRCFYQLFYLSDDTQLLQKIH